MKSIVLSFIVLALCLSEGVAKVIDISETVNLERYTLVDDSTVKYETVRLLKSGKIQVLTSTFEDYTFYGFSEDDFAPISGKPIMNESLYTAYHNLGYLPKWIRSQGDFALGYFTYVIVAVSGKGDPNPAITITTQPESDWAFLDGPAFFYVDVEPSDGLTYQWYLNKKAIPGATSDSLWIDHVTKAQAGVYKVAISSGGPAVMSDGAILTVMEPISIKKQPTSLTVKTGKKATFQVLVAGTPPFHYQWYFGATPILNATNASYTIAKVQGTNAGSYWVAVENEATYAGSSIVSLHVTP